ncbi:MAG TPA: S8 family serine peptidase [Xanthomonadales bacterium]|nr:S8 family serine peptidase [Xanthomonadales bacterium]
MKQQKLAAALGAALALSYAVAGLAAEPDPNRYLFQHAPNGKAAAQAALRAANATIHHELPIANAFAATVPPQALQGLQASGRFTVIEPDAVRYPLAETVPYGIVNTQADQAVAMGANGTGVKVCVIDSGIKANHEDFAGVALSGASGQNWGTDSCGHGTHVAGTINAVGGNGTGVVGVSPGFADLHIVKVFDGASCGWSYASTLLNAAQNCQGAGAKIISMSLGGSTSSTTENTGFSNLYNAGILSIAAAGNGGNNRHSYPASYASVMSVGALDSNNVIADFSQFNSGVDISAPGVGVLSTYPISSGSVSVTGHGSYMAAALEGSPGGPASGALVNGGRCTAAGAWAGKTVLCERGDISFADKVVNVQAGNGAAAIVYNNVSGGFSGTLGGIATSIPSVSLSQEDGQYLVANAIADAATVDARTSNDANGYAYLDGTSMATPHVSGVAALLWSARPEATNTQIRDAMTSTALDLGAAGRDNYYGYGAVRAFNALEALTGGGGSTNNPPTAAFTASCTNLTCSFNGTGSSDSDGTIAGWSWSFGATGSSVSHTFPAAGTYTVTLTVTDDDGATGSSTQSVSVSDSGGGGGITLNGTARKVKGVAHVDLNWSGATSGNVDIFRNTFKIVTANDGVHTDNTGLKGSGSISYRVCNAGTTTCSATINVIY